MLVWLVMKKVRTTIVLPEEDLRLVKILAANNGLSMSEVFHQSLHNISLKPKKSVKEKSGWRAFAGSLNLGGKEPPTREQLYDDYFKEKNSR